MHFSRGPFKGISQRVPSGVFLKGSLLVYLSRGPFWCIYQGVPSRISQQVFSGVFLNGSCISQRVPTDVFLKGPWGYGRVFFLMGLCPGVFPVVVTSIYPQTQTY